jgi:hypothetical protein
LFVPALPAHWVGRGAPAISDWLRNFPNVKSCPFQQPIPIDQNARPPEPTQGLGQRPGLRKMRFQDALFLHRTARAGLRAPRLRMHKVPKHTKLCYGRLSHPSWQSSADGLFRRQRCNFERRPWFVMVSTGPNMDQRSALCTIEPAQIPALTLA